MTYLLPDEEVPGAYRVMFGETQQSWVDPARPDYLLFEYVQQISFVLEHTVLRADDRQRLRVVHIGGGGLSIPRWVEWRRPHTAQVVCEPNVELTAEVRRKVPLPKRTGIKVRDTDGRSAVAAMGDGWADAIILDAFDGSQVPAELVTTEAFAHYRRVLRGTGLIIVNVTDSVPFGWAKRAVAGLARWPHRMVGAEPAVFKGRRFGNLLLVGALENLDATAIGRASAGSPAGYRWLSGNDARAWSGGAEAFTDEDRAASPRPMGSKLWF